MPFAAEAVEQRANIERGRIAGILLERTFDGAGRRGEIRTG